MSDTLNSLSLATFSPRLIRVAAGELNPWLSAPRHFSQLLDSNHFPRIRAVIYSGQSTFHLAMPIADILLLCNHSQL
jgi:hypothetical protein